MNAATPRAAVRTPHANNEFDPQVRPGSGQPFLCGVEEALTWVSYGFFRHIKNQTRPDEPELLGWWHQILNTQVAIGALIAECERAVAGDSHDDTRQRLAVALARACVECSGEAENSSATGHS